MCSGSRCASTRNEVETEVSEPIRRPDNICLVMARVVSDTYTRAHSLTHTPRGAGSWKCIFFPTREDREVHPALGDYFLIATMRWL